MSTNFDNVKNFYPTPESLLNKITQGIDWRCVSTILEPSAGKGNIVDFINKTYKGLAGRWNSYEPDIDCIEKDTDLRGVLKNKNYRVVHDNFLTFKTFKTYDLIIMNPPFDNGARHLLNAINIQKNGGAIICILNAETLKNPFTNERKDLLQKLEKYNASVEYMQNTFVDAERSTDVEIAVVKIDIPKKKFESNIFSNLEKKYYAESGVKGLNELAPNDYIEAAVRRYEMEAEAGVNLIREYNALVPHMLKTLKDDDTYNSPILNLTINGGGTRSKEATENSYIKILRRKYWEALFNNPVFTEGMTSNLRKQYQSRVDELINFDFSLHNIRVLQIEMSKGLIKGIEDTIVEIFDELSHEHSYNEETKRNIHYYNGWKTNKAWYINKKVILPYMNAFSDWNGAF